MVFRIVLVLTVIFVAVPHHPNLGLPVVHENVSPLLNDIRATIASRASAAVEDLHQYDNVVRPDPR